MNYLSFDQFVGGILEALRKARVEYMIGGAVAVWAWGEPRTTQDLDLVVRLDPAQTAPLSQALETMEIYLPTEIMLENLVETRADLPLNAIHGASGFKAELFTLKAGDAHRTAALARKERVDFGPPLGEVYVHSPEDLTLYKMYYFSISEQPKHIRDIGSILRAKVREIDRDYIRQWASQLGLSAIWEAIETENQADVGP
jgi:hypothetical protein